MNGSDDRDEDKILDEKREAAHAAIGRGQAVPGWTEDDHAYARYVEDHPSALGGEGNARQAPSEQQERSAKQAEDGRLSDSPEIDT